ncbi:MAG: hypothetical protein J6P44_02390 [Bacteroidales bacterium]|nr:hypothetical protein [Bacteroidales bacterium]
MAEMIQPYLPLSNNEFAEYVRLNIPREWYFLRYFPLTFTRTFDFKTLEGNETLPVTADIVSFDSPAPKKQRKAIGAWNGTLKKTSISREKDETVIKSEQDAQFLAEKNNDTQAMQSIINDIYDDVDFVTNGIYAQVEAEALSIGSRGFKDFEDKIDGKGNTTKDRINFNIPAENQFGCSADWSDTNTADGIGDIIKIMNFAEDNDKNALNYAFITKRMLANLLNQKATKERLAADLTILTGRAKYQNFTLADLNAYMEKFGYPQFEVINRFVNAEQPNGDSYIYQPWKNNVVTLGPTLQLGRTYYTTVPQVPNVEAQQTYGSFYKITRYGKVDPMLDRTLAEAYVQPALSNRKNLFMLNTANTQWSEGLTASEVEAQG